MARKTPKKKFSLSEQLYTELTKVRFTLNDNRYEINLADEINISQDLDPHQQVERIPAVMGYLSSIIAQLGREANDAKKMLKRTEARIDEKIRKQGIVGEQRILAAVRRHPSWIKAAMKESKAKERYHRAYGLFRALHEKSAILISRGADIRATPSDAIYGVNKDEIILFEEDEE